MDIDATRPVVHGAVRTPVRGRLWLPVHPCGQPLLQQAIPPGVLRGLSGIMAAIAGLKPLVGTLPSSKDSFYSSSLESSNSVLLSAFGNSKFEISLTGRRCVAKNWSSGTSRRCRSGRIVCNAGDVSVSEASAETASPQGGGNWVPVIPVDALPKGERRLVRQDGDTVLLLWYKNDVYAIENSSPAEGAYSEGLINARLTPEGCIVCPSTDTTFDLKTGTVRDWMPSNPVLKLLTPPLRDLLTYPVKIEGDSIYINVKGRKTGESAEIVFGGITQAGRTATNVDVDEVRMVVDDNEKGFGFTRKNEIINGRAALIGFVMLLVQEQVTGKGFLKGIGFLDFLYQYIPHP